MTIRVSYLIIAGLVAYIFISGYVSRKKREAVAQTIVLQKDISDSTIGYYVSKNNELVARNKEISIEAKSLKELDSAKYAELEKQYKSIKNVRYNTGLVVVHDTVKRTDTVLTQIDGVGFAEIHDSCIDLVMKIEGDKAYSEYLLKPMGLEITGIWVKEGKWPFKYQVPYVDSKIITGCGKVDKQKSVVFSREQKKWWQRKWIWGVAGLATGAIIVK